MLVPVNFTGGSYKHKSLPLSAQSTINFWPQKQIDEKALATYVLESYPGKKLFGSTSNYITNNMNYGYAPGRGMFEHKDALYQVFGEYLYSVADDGLYSQLGSIPGAGRCIFAPIGNNFVISTDGIRYHWDGATVTTITSNLLTGNSAAGLNNQILYDEPNGGFSVSDVGDATTINALNNATAESDADDLQRVYTFNQVAFFMGKKTIEPWYNSGNGNPPFDRYEGAQINVGLGAIHSVANDDDSVYFLGDDYQVYLMRGGASSVITPISTAPLCAEFKTYIKTDDAIGWCCCFDGQWQYQLTFPAANKTWAINTGGDTRDWFQLSSGSQGGRDRANSYAFCFGKHLVSDYQTGRIWELDANTYYDNGGDFDDGSGTENGAYIIRTRDSAPIHGGLLKSPGKELTMNRLEILLECGVGLVSDIAQGYDPEIMVSFSDDGGRSFSTQEFVKTGRLGDFQHKVELFNCGTFTSRIIRLQVSDPVHWCIYGGAAEIEVGI